MNKDVHDIEEGSSLLRLSIYHQYNRIVIAGYIFTKLGMPNFSVTVSQKVLFAVTPSQLGVFVRFSITPDNQKDVWIYIYNKLQNDSSYLTFDDCKKEDNAKALFRSIKPSDDSATNDLDTWCKTFLQDKQISSLRAALRKKLSRRNKDTISIELDRDIYSDLNDLAAADGITLKDYLAALIQDRYQVVQPPVAALIQDRYQVVQPPVAERANLRKKMV